MELPTRLMIPTPRTDANESEGLIRGCATPTKVVLADFARQLERENAELLEALEACMKIIGPPDALPDECWATTDEINNAWDKGSAVIAKIKIIK